MNFMDTKLLNPEKIEDIKYAGEVLRAGGLVAIPTETVYGLAANALDPEAAGKIYAVKGRPSDNPLIVHISRISDMEPLVREIPEAARRLAEAFWPGPLTMILPKTELVPDTTSGGLKTVAIRFPADPTARAVIEAAGCPLAAPSANLSGKPSPTDFRHVFEDLNGKVEAIVDGGACSVGVESTVITLVSEVPKVLRPGGVTVEQLQAVLGRVEVDEAVTHQLQAGEQAASPGMKYKHYSPKAQVVLADLSRDDFVKLVNGSDGWGALCFEGEESKLRGPCVSYGREYDSESQAQRLFSALYELDERGIARAYARRPLKKGVGLAVYNRLVRAAGFQILSPDVKVYGLTGTTGSGKTAVSGLLQKQGFAVIDCDKLTKTGIYDEACLRELAAFFGSDILRADGTLDRRLLAQRAFSSEENTIKLNSITFPRIDKAIRGKIEELREKGNRRILLDAPTLFEAGADALCCRVIAVTAPASLRLERIRKRDGLSLKEAKLRLEAQRPEEYYAQRADFVIYNDSTGSSLASAVEELLKEAT